MALVLGSFICLLPFCVQSESQIETDSNLAPWEKVQVVSRANSESQDSEEVSVIYNNISRVILFVSSFCSECEQVSEYLKKNGVNFQEEYVIAGTRSLLGLVREEQTPTTKIIYRDGTSRRVIGFDEKILDTLFAKDHEISSDDSFDISGSDSEFELR